MRISAIAAPVAIVSSLALASCSLIGGEPDETPAAKANDTSETSNSDPLSELPESVVTIEPVTWAFPENVAGWTPGDNSQAGINQIVNDEGCQFTSQAIAHDGDQPPGDLSKSNEQLEHWKEPVIAASPDASFDTNESDEVTTDTGEPVTMLRTDTTYIGDDGANYRTTVWIRSFTEADRAGTVSLTYGCPEPVYSEEALKGLLDQTHLLNVPAGQNQLK